MGNIIQRFEKLKIHVRPDLGARFDTTMDKDEHGHIRIIPIVGVFRTDKHAYIADQIRNSYICYLDDSVELMAGICVEKRLGAYMMCNSDIPATPKRLMEVSVTENKAEQSSVQQQHPPGGVKGGLGGIGGSGGKIDSTTSISAMKENTSISSTGGSGGTIKDKSSINETKESSSISSISSKPGLPPSPRGNDSPEVVCEKFSDSKAGEYKICVELYSDAEINFDYLKGEVTVYRRHKVYYLAGKEETRCENWAELKKAMKRIRKKSVIRQTRQLLKKVGAMVETSYREYTDPVVEATLNELKQKGYRWFLEQTKHIVGFEREKLIALSAIISSRLPRFEDSMSRINIAYIGKPGRGKSSIPRAIGKYFANVVHVTGVSENVLVYSKDVFSTLDGIVFYYDQMDRPPQYFRESTTEDELSKLVTIKDPRTGKFTPDLPRVEGQATWLTTIVRPDYSVEQDRRILRLVVPQIEKRQTGESISRRKRVSKESRNDLMRKRIAVMKWLDTLDFSEADPMSDPVYMGIYNILLDVDGDNFNTAVELLRNLWYVWRALGDTSVITLFTPELILHSWNIDMAEYEILKALKGSPATMETILHLSPMSTDVMEKVLNRLANKGLVVSRIAPDKIDNMTITRKYWSLSETGNKLVDALEKYLDTQTKKVNGLTLEQIHRLRETLDKDADDPKMVKGLAESMFGVTLTDEYVAKLIKSWGLTPR